jgi:hypothetical protein
MQTTEQNGESHKQQNVQHTQHPMTPNTPHDDHHGHHETIIIDGKTYSGRHEDLTGRRVLEIAGRHPIDNYIVLWLGPDHVLEDLGLDEHIHPQQHQIQEFFTFDSDRSYRFDLDGRREEWGAPFITEATLRKLAGAGKDDRIVQEFHGQHDRVLKPGERVDLTGEGIEKFKTERAIIITVVNEDNGKEFQLVGFKETKIATLIERMYTKLGVTRQNDDRLRCEGGGDVFPFADLTLGAYLEAGHCHCKVWVFVGGTGGAACR